MKRILATLTAAAFAFLALSFALSPRAEARMMFGKDETIHFIQEVKVTGAKGEELFLGYKTGIQYFIAGIFVSDDGYVLGVKGDSKRFYHMPKGAELASFQERGLLPKPLPAYSLGLLDYLLGYSAWIILGGFALFYLIQFMRRGRAQPRTGALVGGAGPPPGPDA